MLPSLSLTCAAAPRAPTAALVSQHRQQGSPKAGPPGLTLATPACSHSCAGGREQVEDAAGDREKTLHQAETPADKKPSVPCDSWGKP